MDKKRYHEIEDGETIILVPEPKCRLSCCNCGLTHDYEFRLLVKIKENKKATAQIRRHKKENG